MPHLTGAEVRNPELTRLTGLPFDDGDEVLRAAIDDASVPALLMSMVHMTGDLERPRRTAAPVHAHRDGPAGWDERAGQTGWCANRAFDVVRDYRDQGLPAAVRARRAPAAGDARRGHRRSGDRRIRRLHRRGPQGHRRRPVRAGVGIDAPSSAPASRSWSSVAVRPECSRESSSRQAGVPFTIVEQPVRSRAGPGWPTDIPGCRVDIASQYYTYSFEPTDHWWHHYADPTGDPAVSADVIDRYDLAEHVRFDTEVTGAVWDEAASSVAGAGAPHRGRERRHPPTRS